MVYSIAGLLGGAALVARAPVPRAAPHGLGGRAGRRRARRCGPGEISLAHNGVLFLDELLEFPRPVLEALRQPLEDRAVTIVRARRGVTYPADFMLIAALNPCPCGHLGSTRPHLHLLAGGDRRATGRGSRDRCSIASTCTSTSRRCRTASWRTAEPGESSARRSATRVDGGARAPAGARPALRTRASSSTELRRVAPLDGAGHALLERAVARLGLSARAITRVRRVARTIADLAGSAGDRDRPPRRGAPVPRSRSTQRP